MNTLIRHAVAITIITAVMGFFVGNLPTTLAEIDTNTMVTEVEEGAEVTQTVEETETTVEQEVTVTVDDQPVEEINDAPEDDTEEGLEGEVTTDDPESEDTLETDDTPEEVAEETDAIEDGEETEEADEADDNVNTEEETDPEEDVEEPQLAQIYVDVLGDELPEGHNSIEVHIVCEDGAHHIFDLAPGESTHFDIEAQKSIDCSVTQNLTDDQAELIEETKFDDDFGIIPGVIKHDVGITAHEARFSVTNFLSDVATAIEQVTQNPIDDVVNSPAIEAIFQIDFIQPTQQIANIVDIADLSPISLPEPAAVLSLDDNSASIPVLESASLVIPGDVDISLEDEGGITAAIADVSVNPDEELVIIAFMPEEPALNSAMIRPTVYLLFSFATTLVIFGFLLKASKIKL